MEFGLPGGRLCVHNLGVGLDSDHPPWGGEPVDVHEPAEWATGCPRFRPGPNVPGADCVEAVWTDGSAWFSWRFVVYKDPACIESRFACSPGWTSRPQGNGLTRITQGSRESFSTIESSNPQVTAVRGDDLLATVAINARHVSVRGVHLHDITDYFDYLVEESTIHGGHLGGHAFTGNILECTNRANGDRLLLVRMAPTPEAAFTREHGVDFQWVNRRGVAVYGTGLDRDAAVAEGVSSYSLLLLPVTDGPAVPVWRAHYRQRMQRTVFSEPLNLSNTWGDRNQDAALDEAFALRELTALEAAGIRGLMLDDGWQAGVTANSKLRKGGIWEGYHASDSTFWAVHPEKFSRGLGPIATAAREAGKELALWFSPDSSNDFTNWEKDVAILLDLYRLHGIRSFKLDGIKLRTRRGEARFGRFLDALASGSDGRIVPILDVTSEIRQGYFREIDHGILFLENRYTDWGNYYPYRTLRNVWQLSRWIPAQRLHIEFLNPRRNADKYAGDPFAPERYSIDYLYAMTLVGHPLAWMEVQHVDPDDRRELKQVADWHAENHRYLMSADIAPIGDLPDGRSWSGFRFDFPDGSQGVLVFRDNSQKDMFILGCTADLSRRIGCSDAAIRRMDPGHVELRLPRTRSWVYASSGERPSSPPSRP